jgi:hypothetical protein
MPLPFKLLSRRAGPLGLALTAYDVWRRLPPNQRRQILDVARKHGPRTAARVVNGARQRRPGRPPKL